MIYPDGLSAEDLELAKLTIEHYLAGLEEGTATAVKLLVIARKLAVEAKRRELWEP